MEWRKLSEIHAGDVTCDGATVTVAPIRYLGDCGMYAVRDTDGVTYTDLWSWDEELYMMER